MIEEERKRAVRWFADIVITAVLVGFIVGLVTGKVLGEVFCA